MQFGVRDVDGAVLIEEGPDTSHALRLSATEALAWAMALLPEQLAALDADPSSRIVTLRLLYRDPEGQDEVPGPRFSLTGSSAPAPEPSADDLQPLHPDPTPAVEEIDAPDRMPSSAPPGCHSASRSPGLGWLALLALMGLCLKGLRRSRT